MVVALVVVKTGKSQNGELMNRNNDSAAQREPEHYALV
jgi:hypothetical protein